MSDPRPRLVIFRGHEILSTVFFGPDGELVVGRTRQCHVVLAVSTISRMHARLYTERDAVYLEDLSSANGTFVDEARVHGIVRLEDHQVIRLGQGTSAEPTLIRFQVVGGESESGATRPVSALESEPPGRREPGSDSEAGRSTVVEQLPPESSADTVVTDLPPDDATTKTDYLPPPPAPRPSRRDLRTRRVAVPKRPPRPLRWRPLALVVGGLLLLIIGLLSLRGYSSEVTWDDAILHPDTLRPGDQLEISNIPVAPGDLIELRIGGAEFTDVVVGTERLTATTPGVGGLSPGDHALTVVAIRGDRAMLEAITIYRNLGRVVALDPAEAHYGDIVVATGHSLPSGDDAVVEVGGAQAEILAASPQRIVFRVPAVSASLPGQIPVRLASEATSIDGPPLAVLSRGFEPMQPTLEAVSAGGDTWEVRWGPHALLRLEAKAEEGAAVPTRVQAALAATRALLTRSPDTSAVPEVRVEAGGGRLRVTATTAGQEPILIADLGVADLGNDGDAPAKLRAEWLAEVWSDLLPVVHAGTAPEEMGLGATHRAVLQQLVEANRARGGSGVPDRADWGRLPEEDLAGLAGAFLSLPPGLQPVRGRWTGQLDNVFYPQDEYQVALTLDLDQRGTRLSGEATVTFRGHAGNLELPPSPVQGRIEHTIPPRLTLTVELNRPVGEVILTGMALDTGLQGDFDTSLAGAGQWWARRPATP